MTIKSLLLTVLRITIGMIFLFSGIAKLTSLTVFISNVAAYEILPTLLIKPISYLLVSAEITLGIALCIGYFSRGSGLLASILFMTFTIVLIIVLLQKLSVTNCGCENILFSFLDTIGVSVSTTPNWKIVLIDVALAATCFWIACSPQRGYGIESLISQILHNPTKTIR